MEISFRSTDILSVSEAAKSLGVTRVTLYRWIDKGKIQSLMFGGYRAIPRSEVDRLKQEGLKRQVVRRIVAEAGGE